MNIIITCALLVEFNEARNQLGLKEITKKADMPRIAEGRGLYLIYTGIGKVNSVLNSYETLNKIKPDLVIDSGTCGSLIDEIKPMDIVTSIKAIEFFSYDFKGKSIEIEKSLVTNILQNCIISDYVVASIEDSVDKLDHRVKLKAYGASIVTWETSSVFNLCNKLNIPFISIRGVTDNCNENTSIDFKKNRIQLCKKLYISVKLLCKGI